MVRMIYEFLKPYARRHMEIKSLPITKINFKSRDSYFVRNQFLPNLLTSDLALFSSLAT